MACEVMVATLKLVIGTCLKSQDSSLQVGVHVFHALISDRNVFKESGFIVASWGSCFPRFN